MPNRNYSPITDPREIDKLLDELPLALERESFIGYVTGFPRRYLTSTPPEDIVKHYLLMQNLGQRPVISSLARQDEAWKLVVIARNRHRLFVRIAGALSCLGANIVSAEAFGNRRALVLDTFLFKDLEGRCEISEERERIHAFLEEAVEGKLDLDALITEKIRQDPQPTVINLDLQFDHPPDLGMTKMTLRARDHFGLLYEVSRVIASAGCEIEMAYIDTVGDEALDHFYLTCDGLPLSSEQERALQQSLEQLSPQECDPA